MFVYLNGRRVWVELQAADTGGNDSGSSEDTPADKVLTGIQSLLKRHGNDAEAAVRVLYRDNYDLRDEVRQLKGKVPADGSVTLSGEDATAWTAYQALGKPADLKTAVEERTSLQGKLAGLERDGVLRNVAEAAGYKPTVLSNLDQMAKTQGKALSYEVREVTQDGKAVKVAYVKDGATEQALTDYAAAQWPDFMPALAVQGTQQQQQPAGIRFPVQGTGGNGQQGKTDLTAKFIAEQQTKQAAVKNPLLEGR